MTQEEMIAKLQELGIVQNNKQYNTMKLNNGQNIINDQDINLTGSNIGKTLSSFLNKQQEDIDKLKSNVKWLYKYGGVGSGGGGTGSGSSSNYSV